MNNGFPSLPFHPKKILFVCTANMCRSAFAEAIFKEMLSKQGLELEVHSAGTQALPGRKSPPGILYHLQKDGMDLRGHRSQKITRELIEESDIIFVMERGHRAALLAQASSAGEKIFLLSDFYSGPEKFSLKSGVPDPIGMGDFFYENVKEIIRHCCQTILEQLTAISLGAH